MAKQKIKTKKCKRCKDRKLIDKFKRNSKSKDGYISVCIDCIKVSMKNNNKTPNKFYIYKFMNRNDEVLYVGKTTDINKRVQSHLDDYITMKTSKPEMYSDLYKIEYCELQSGYHMSIYEIHYICKYNPLFNIEHKTENTDIFNLPEVKWETFIHNLYFQNFYSHQLMTHGVDSEFQNLVDLKERYKNDMDFRIYFQNLYYESDYIHKLFNPEDYILNN